MAFTGRKKLTAQAPDAKPDTPGPDAVDGEVMPLASAIGADIPPHVWALLQEAGEAAALRLVQVLKSPAFGSYSPGAQRGLIELALTRAYGLPIRKALNVNLSTSDSDAVAASLADLGQALPETAQTRLRETLNGADPSYPSQKH
jgi:hypothetical protein